MASLGLLPHQLADLVNLTLRKYERRTWVDISLSLTKYFGIGNLLLDPRQNESGGTQLEWKVQVSHSGAATNTALYAKQEINVQDVTTAAFEPWSFQQTHFAYDEREESFNSGPERIVQEIAVRRHDALDSLTELMEENFWSKPANDTDQSERLKPKGMTYWIVPNATKGFNGAAPTNFSLVAGLSPSTYANWNNYTDTFKTVSRTDLGRKIRNAMYQTQFMNPNQFPDGGSENGRVRCGVATTYNVCQILEELLEQQNDNLGGDLDKYYGAVRFRGNPVMPVPYLDSNAGSGTAYNIDPLIGINFDVMKAKWKTGYYFNWGRPKDAPYQDLVKHVHMNNSMQYCCKNRRKCFYIYKVT